jgi:cytochrome c553
MPRPLALLLAASCVAISMLASLAEARPLYLKGFVEKYPKVEKQARAAKCAICHVPDEQNKVRNDYGQAVGKALPMPNAKKPAQIDQALDDAAKAKNPAGVPFGKVIEMGKLPND